MSATKSLGLAHVIRLHDACKFNGFRVSWIYSVDGIRIA